jgi:NitT/TauT family transport system substrate-binding protein
MIAASVPACLACSATAETLKVAVAQRGFWNSSFIEFALQQGFFKQEGLDIEILYTEGGASTLTPVVAGSIDIAMTNGTLGAIAAFAKARRYHFRGSDGRSTRSGRATGGIKTIKDTTERPRVLLTGVVNQSHHPTIMGRR